MKRLCTSAKTFLNRWPRKTGAGIAASLFLEGFAVGALIHGGVHLVGADQDLVQGAVIGALTVVGALLDRTLDALVAVAVHSHSSFS